MRSLWSRWLLASGLMLGSPTLSYANPEINIQLNVYWEGRDLKDPNLEALGRLRKGFPDIPLTHLINPAYFLDEAKATENMQALQLALQEKDEVGLYLAPVESLVRDAGLILKLQPSFWGYVDEGEVCENDCGLDVPLTVYNREEVLKIFASAHQVMQKAGFANLQSFAVRGWLEAPFLTQLAAAFGYRFDLSPIDPSLVESKLREFPIAAWVAQRWGNLTNADGETIQRFSKARGTLQFLPQTGGVLELNEQREILARFDKLVKTRREHPNFTEPFTLGISVETAFQSWPKLRMILQSIQERALAQKLDLQFSTVSSTKNSRPVAANMRISTRLSAEAGTAK